MGAAPHWSAGEATGQATGGEATKKAPKEGAAHIDRRDPRDARSGGSDRRGRGHKVSASDKLCGGAFPYLDTLGISRFL